MSPDALFYDNSRSWLPLPQAAVFLMTIVVPDCHFLQVAVVFTVPESDRQSTCH